MPPQGPFPDEWMRSWVQAGHLSMDREVRSCAPRRSTCLHRCVPWQRVLCGPLPSLTTARLRPLHRGLLLPRRAGFEQPGRTARAHQPAFFGTGARVRAKCPGAGLGAGAQMRADAAAHTRLGCQVNSHCTHSVSELQMSLNVSKFMDVVRVLGQSSVGQRHAPDTLESFTVPSGLTSNNSIKVPTRD